MVHVCSGRNESRVCGNRDENLCLLTAVGKIVVTSRAVGDGSLCVHLNDTSIEIGAYNIMGSEDGWSESAVR